MPISQRQRGVNNTKDSPIARRWFDPDNKPIAAQPAFNMVLSGKAEITANGSPKQRGKYF
jgi:hypothetical protein